MSTLQILWIIAGFPLGIYLGKLFAFMVKEKVSGGMDMANGLVCSLACYTLTVYPLRYLWDR